MEKKNKVEEPLPLATTPNWLRAIQVNSWEAELLISALLLYVLFQIPDYLETYRRINFSSSDPIFRLIGFFRHALIILSIGYVIHIITRGIWVANIGLGNVFPKGVDLTRLKLRGRFKKEVEKNTSLDSIVLQLEKIASITYAVSFMCSGLMISLGMVLVTLIIYTKWVFMPALESGIGWYYALAILGLFTYLLILLIVFVDFLTNGYFRRDSWAAKPYYYLALFFRYFTLSFIYNRTLLTVLSNLPRWQAHAIPFLLVIFITGYAWIGKTVENRKKEDYYTASFDNVRYENYENLRDDDSKLFVTIQEDVIADGVIKLFVNELDEFKSLYSKDSTRIGGWSKLEIPDKIRYLQKFIAVKIDSVELDSLTWHWYKHPVAFSYGYLSYIDVSHLNRGNHLLLVALDTLSMQSRQLEFLKDQEPSTIIQANIPFFLTR